MTPTMARHAADLNTKWHVGRVGRCSGVRACARVWVGGPKAS